MLKCDARHFTLSDHDLALWQELLDVTISSARLAGDPSDQVLENVAMHFHDQSERYVSRQTSHPIDALTQTSFSQCSQMVTSLLSHLTMHDDRSIPRTFLKAVDEFLCNLYTAKQEDRYPILQSFRTLTSLLQACPQHAIVLLVSNLSDGLCIWIRDEEEVLPDKEYNELVRSPLRISVLVSSVSSFRS